MPSYIVEMNFLRKIFRLVSLFIVFMFGVSKLSFCQTSKGPIAEFDMVSYDFGEILQGKNTEVVFTLTNKGEFPLVIEDINVSCGCTLVNWKDDPILPNQSSKIVVKYNTNIIGSIKRSIVVNTNDRYNDRILLMLTGNVVSSYED